MSEQLNLFDLLQYESISLARQIQNEEIERESDAYNEALYQKSVENNLSTQPDCQEKDSPTSPRLKKGDRVYNSVIKVFGTILEPRYSKQLGATAYLIQRDYSEIRELWSDENCGEIPVENNQFLLIEQEKVSEEPPDPDDYPDFDSYSKANNSFWERSLKSLEEKSVWQKQDFEDCHSIMMSVLMSSSVWDKANQLYKSRLKLVSIKIDKENIPLEKPLPKMRGRPPGTSNKHKSGSFYKRGVNKKGVEQWSFHYHYYDDGGKVRKTSISVPFEKLRQAKNIAHFKGTEDVIKFLRGKMSSSY